MISTLNKIKDGVLDILWPKMCLGCGKEGAYICKDCFIFFSEINPSENASPSGASLLKIVSVWEYEGLMEKLIRKIKYDGCYDIIVELVNRAFDKIELNLPQDTYITYVPMYKKKEKRRGFNQAKLIAEKVGEKTGRPVLGLLEKVKDNKSQVDLGPQERQENVKNIFSVKRSITQVPASVLIVDDVYTTGATLTECTQVLRKSGVKQVFGFTLARKLSL